MTHMSFHRPGGFQAHAPIWGSCTPLPQEIRVHPWCTGEKPLWGGTQLLFSQLMVPSSLTWASNFSERFVCFAMTRCLHSVSYLNSCVTQAILPRLDYVTLPLRHTEENNQVTWHDTWNQAVRSIFFFFLPAVYSHTSIRKANRAVSHNHLCDEPRQCKEPWLPLQLAKTHK